MQGQAFILAKISLETCSEHSTRVWSARKVQHIEKVTSQ